jgi:hypothetical protein
VSVHGINAIANVFERQHGLVNVPNYVGCALLRPAQDSGYMVCIKSLPDSHHLLWRIIDNPT